jgi:hypothetical protein
LLAEKHSRDGLVVRMALEVGKHCDEVEQPEGQVRQAYVHAHLLTVKLLGMLTMPNTVGLRLFLIAV